MTSRRGRGRARSPSATPPEEWRSGKVDFADPTFTRGVGTKSPLLTLQLATGRRFTNVTVVRFRTGSTEAARSCFIVAANAGC